MTALYGLGRSAEVLGRLVAMQPEFSIKVVKVVTTGDNLAMVYNDWTVSARRPGQQIEVAAGKAIGGSPPAVGRNVAVRT